MAQVQLNILIWHTNLRDLVIYLNLNNTFKTAVIYLSGSLRPRIK